MLILKHVRNWSYETLEREVRANVAYRSLCRIGMEKVPDAKMLVRLGQAIGPETIAELHDRIVDLAQRQGVMIADNLINIGRYLTPFPARVVKGGYPAIAIAANAQNPPATSVSCGVELAF